ncbi:FliM/FliN family flagellar motor switch protein [Ralstonia flaminis]|jgi:flagellar motor switch protein FliN/FliY|uniref:Flagellar motor switch protein FliN n=1 Tax=Ralstonia flaminis TaxID=3058597 RepID=A0ABN9JU89_9RALS|nr:FliM/FliN family flagellar motor switch protein [Ralstonia sp. LMG 18101]CAJ0822581.1 Flagellar motor switch protein FliN [Ralstonia sp. LMG 18101]
MSKQELSHVGAPASGEGPVTVQTLAYEPLTQHVSGGGAVLQSTSPLLAVRARLEVCVGEVELTVGELLAAKDGHVLRLDRAVDQPVDIRLDGKVVARGLLVAVGESFAVRLTELPMPLVP